MKEFSKEAGGLGHERERCSLGTPVPITCATIHPLPQPLPSSVVPGTPSGGGLSPGPDTSEHPGRSPMGSRAQPCGWQGSCLLPLSPEAALAGGVAYSGIIA